MSQAMRAPIPTTRHLSPQACSRCNPLLCGCRCHAGDIIKYSLFDETLTVDGVVYDADRIRALVLERHQLATEINDLRARLKGAHTHLVQRTRALTRVISRERRQSAVVIGDTAYFPGRVREILEQYHRKGTA